MALEGTYEYECMRAELLGGEPPDYDEFMKIKVEREAAEKEAFEAESLREAHVQKEGFQQVGGKLDELNSILRSTQKKINNLTAPFSKYLKSKMGMSSGNADVKDESLKEDRAELESDSEEYTEQKEKEIGVQYPVTCKTQGDDFNPNYMPLIDDIIEKYEKTQVGIEYQNKQMKRMLK